MNKAEKTPDCAGVRVALVSGCDANYYPLLLEWLHSVRACPDSTGVDLCVLDGGLTDGQVADLRALGVVSIVAPDWPPDLPPGKVAGHDYLKPCVLRPFLPRIFPGYDVYMWMDADTWVQDWSSVALYLQGAAHHHDRLFATGANRHAVRKCRIKWLWRWPYRVASFYFVNGRRAFGMKIAKELAPFHVISAGCFALHARAPHWARWQALVLQAARRGRLFPAEQVSLGGLIHLERYAAELLTAYTHWVCDIPPLWNTQSRMFEEPFSPHAVLGVLHLSGVDAMRADRTQKVPYQTETGDRVMLNIRYPHCDGGMVGPPKRA